MTYVETSEMCCGVHQIMDLGHSKTPEIALRYIKGQLRLPFVVFSGVTKRIHPDHSSSRMDNYGQAFASFLKKKKLGRVTSSLSRVNPNSNNTIKVWVWEPDYKALRSFKG